MVNPDCCFDYDLVKDLLRAIGRAYPSDTSTAGHAKKSAERTWDIALADRVLQLQAAGARNLSCNAFLGLIAFVRDGEGAVADTSTDCESTPRVPKVRTSHHRNKEEAARLQKLVDERLATSDYADDWRRQIINAGGDENIAKKAIALAALNGLFDHFAAQPQNPRDAELLGNLPLREALEAIVSWRYDTLGSRPAQSLDGYDEKLRAAFDRGARMAFYRCADRAAAALSDTSTDGEGK